MPVIRNNFGNTEKWKQERQKLFSEYGWELLFFDEDELNEKEVVVRLR